MKKGEKTHRKGEDWKRRREGKREQKRKREPKTEVTAISRVHIL